MVVSNLSDGPVPDVRLTLATGPLCDTPGVEPLLGSSPGLYPPIGNATGGLDAWPVGDLGPHQDLILKMTP